MQCQHSRGLIQSRNGTQRQKQFRFLLQSSTRANPLVAAIKFIALILRAPVHQLRHISFMSSVHRTSSTISCRCIIILPQCAPPTVQSSSFSFYFWSPQFACPRAHSFTPKNEYIFQKCSFPLAPFLIHQSVKL